MYLDYAEDQARKRKPLYMADWRKKLDAFLQFNEREILHNAGNVAMEVAKRLAETEYEKFHARRLSFEQSQNLTLTSMTFASVPNKATKNQTRIPNEPTR